MNFEYVESQEISGCIWTLKNMPTYSRVWNMPYVERI